MPKRIGTLLLQKNLKDQSIKRLGVHSLQHFSAGRPGLGLKMPKAKQNKRNSASSSPYADAAARTKAANSIFRMNRNIGQHVLKNPGIADKLVEKADLKQSDVCTHILFQPEPYIANTVPGRSRNRTGNWKPHCPNTGEG